MFALIALLVSLTLDPAFVASTVASLGAIINREYFDPKVGREVEAALRQSLAAGRYASAKDRDRVPVDRSRTAGAWRDALERALKTVEARP